MPTKRNDLIKVIDAKIVDVKRALEAKGIKLETTRCARKHWNRKRRLLQPLPVPPPGGATGSVEVGQTAPTGGKPTEGDKTPAPKTAATAEG